MQFIASALAPPFSSAADVAVRRPPTTEKSFSIPGVRPASALEIRPAPDMVPFGIASLDALTGGVPRGALTEMVGPASSGRTSVMLSLIAEVTRRQEVCALIDVTDSFDPASAEAAGIDLKRVLWVRCGQNTNQQSATERQQVTQPRMRPAATIANVAPTPHTANVWSAPGSNEQAITYGCFEAARGRREPAAQIMNKIAPPAKNISWSIHENYDSRLRHAMVNGGESYRSHAPSPVVKNAASPMPRRVTPQNFAAAQRMKWNRLDQALKATDLLLQSGGFGLVIVDLGDIASEQARRIPLTSWFRFRRVVESTPTIFMVVAKESCAKTCASLVLQLSAHAATSGRTNQLHESGCPLTHVSLLDGLNVHVELLRTRLERKPVRSAGAHLETQTHWKKTG
jgi:recombination protein RecA